MIRWGLSFKHRGRVFPQLHIVSSHSRNPKEQLPSFGVWVDHGTRLSGPCMIPFTLRFIVSSFREKTNECQSNNNYK